jgi:transcriptional regulator with XRE-family HTH domain
MKQFGEKLRRLRTRQGLSLRQLSKQLNLSSHSYLDRLERGTSKPSIDLLIHISDFFDVTTDYLVRDEIELK